MTLSSTTVKVSYSGDDSTTAFSVTFVFWDNGDVEAVLRASDGTETTWVEDTDYTLTGGSGSTGTLTATTAPATGETLVIRSNRDDTQPTALPLGGDFPSTAVEQALDQNVRLVQQHHESLSRIPTLSVTSTASTPTIPDPQADQLLGWNSAGDDLANIAFGDVSTDFDSVISTVADGDVLFYDDGTSRWINTQYSSLTTQDILRWTGSVWDNLSAGKQSPPFIPASEFTPATTNGCAALATIEVASGQPTYQYLAFDAATPEYAFLPIVLPDRWDGGTVRVDIFWTPNAGATAFSCVWEVGLLFVADGDNIGQAYTNVATGIDLGTVNHRVYKIGASITTFNGIGGAVDGGTLAWLRLGRDADDGVSDTLDVDAHFIGVRLYFDANAWTDD